MTPSWSGASSAFPEAERHAREAISLPIYPRLGEAQGFVIETLRFVLAR